MVEIWKNIKGYEGLYQVSNLGRVKRICDCVLTGMYGQSITYRHKDEIIKGFKGKRQNDYWRIYLYKDGERKKHTIHRLVYETFVGEIPKGYQVNHIDENKDNNCLSNLNLLTARKNCNWGTRNERIVEKHFKPVEQYSKDMTLIAEYPSVKEASIQTGVNKSQISGCCLGKYQTAGGYIWKYSDNQ